MRLGSRLVPGDWSLTERGLDLDRMAQTESVFTLSNGHVGVRGNFDEGEPHALPGTYLNGFHETRPLPYAEAGYGYPEAGQTVVDVTNGKLIRLMVDDEPLDVRYGTVLHHERTLDFRAGTLHRRVEWRSPGHRDVRVTSTRLVSLTQRAMLGIEYSVEVLDGPARVVIQSSVMANEDVPAASGDPRVAAALDHPLEPVERDSSEGGVYLLHRTRRSGLGVAVLMDHMIDGPEDTDILTESFADLGRVTIIANLEPGQTLRMVKLVGYGWSRERSGPGLRDQVSAAVAAARHTGWEGLLAEQRQYLDDFWDRADVEIDGDDELQHALRFALFHVLQAGARAETRAIPAKGLTGPGYDGHAFWDTEIFVLPVLTYLLPTAVRDALLWRHSILPQAEERAAYLGFGGASFPWRTIAGEECSAYWPAGTAALHVNADIADAVLRYGVATGDAEFLAHEGRDLLVATARLWCSYGYFDRAGRFCIDGVTGPDEYSAVADNNVYTNLMARRNLQAAALAVERHHRPVTEVDAQEVAAWRAAADAMALPWDADLGVHSQSERFTQRERWDFSATGAMQYPLMLHFPYLDLYRKQVCKQADLVMALYLCGDAFTDAEKVAGFEYYEPLTVRDSSLSACIQAIMAAETGHLDLAYDYLGEAALMDLDDLEHNTRDGLHIASLAGSWLAVVGGFGGMRDHAGSLSFRPRLPDGLSRLAFNIMWHGSRLRVEVTPGHATYTVRTGDAVHLQHHGEDLTIGSGETVTRSIPTRAERPRPDQPPGREPGRRRVAPSAGS